MRKDEALDDLQSNHESEMSSLKGQLAHQTQTHNNHQSQLEEHYQLMVEDLKNKLKVLFAIAVEPQNFTDSEFEGNAH